MKKTALLLICLLILFSRAAWAEEDEAFLPDTWYDLSSIAADVIIPVRCAVVVTGQRVQNDLRPYFELENVKKGVFGLAPNPSQRPNPIQPRNLIQPPSPNRRRRPNLAKRCRRAPRRGSCAAAS